MIRSEHRKAYQQKYYADKYRTRRESGRCVVCGEPVRQAAALCFTCSLKRNEYIRRRRADLKAAGICVICCKNKAADGFTACEDCKRQQRERYIKRRRASIRRRLASNFQFEPSRSAQRN